MSEGAVRKQLDGLYLVTVSDHLGSPRSVFTSTGVTVESNYHYPYGLKIELLSSTGTGADENPDGWAGGTRVRDFSITAQVHGRRVYEPAIGGWFGVEPLAEKYAGVSVYNYTGGDPVNRTDPTGYDYVLPGNNDNFGQLFEAGERNQLAWFERIGMGLGMNSLYAGGGFAAHINWKPIWDEKGRKVVWTPEGIPFPIEWHNMKIGGAATPGNGGPSTPCPNCNAVRGSDGNPVMIQPQKSVEIVDQMPAHLKTNKSTKGTAGRGWSSLSYSAKAYKEIPLRGLGESLPPVIDPIQADVISLDVPVQFGAAGAVGFTGSLVFIRRGPDQGFYGAVSIDGGVGWGVSAGLGMSATYFDRNRFRGQNFRQGYSGPYLTNNLGYGLFSVGRTDLFSQIAPRGAIGLPYATTYGYSFGIGWSALPGFWGGRSAMGTTLISGKLY